MFAPEQGPAVQKVQEALIDLEFPLPIHGADALFGDETGEAVTAYKRKKGLTPDDPVVGPGTMAALNQDCLDKPPAPLVNVDEWRSWKIRASQPHVGHLNFTRGDEISRRASGTPFRMDANSGWMPPTLLSAFLDSLAQLLEPSGSPAGFDTPAATWGVGPFDLYHCHLSLFGPLVPMPGDFATDRSDIQERIERLRSAASSAAGAVPHNGVWCAEYARLLLADDIGTLAGQAAERALAHGSVATPLILLWHSFESSAFRPASIPSNSPQRHWMTQLAPPILQMMAFALTTPDEVLHNTAQLYQISFLISKTGEVSAMIGGGLEVMSLAGLDYDLAMKIAQPIQPTPAPQF